MSVKTQPRIEKERTLTSERQAFWGGASAVPGGGDIGYVQIINPSGTGFRVYPEELHCTYNVNNAAAELINVAYYDTPLANLGQAQNKYRGGIFFAPNAEVRTENIGGPALGTLIGSFYLVRGQPYQFLVGHPIRLLPGQGLIMYPANAGEDLDVFMEWKEIEAV